jgi:hypothetical protein
MIASVVLYDFRGGAWLVSSAGLVDRAAVQWLVARGMNHSFSGIFAWTGVERFDGNEFLFHSALHSPNSDRARNLDRCTHHRGSVHCVPGLLYSAGEGQEDGKTRATRDQSSGLNHNRRTSLLLCFSTGGNRLRRRFRRRPGDRLFVPARISSCALTRLPFRPDPCRAH